LDNFIDFSRKYLWNRSSKRQAKNGVINNDFFCIQQKIGEFWSIDEKSDLGP